MEIRQDKFLYKGLPRRPDLPGLLAMTQKRNARLTKIFILIFGLSFIASGCNRQTSSPAPIVGQLLDYTHQLQIGSQTLNVEIANTPAKQQQGLSGRKSMAQNQGMLFEFGAPAKTAFWMKDMNFNLDFIWIVGGKVVGITPDVPAPIGNFKFEAGNLPLYYPPSPVNWVVEVNAGWAKKNNIGVGDDVQLK